MNTIDKLYNEAKKYQESKIEGNNYEDKAISYCIYQYIVKEYVTDALAGVSKNQLSKIKAELEKNNYIISEDIEKKADSIIDEIIIQSLASFGNENEDEIPLTPLNIKSFNNSYVIQEPESVKIWNWGEIIFWTIIICSIGILTPLAFLYKRLIRGFSIIVKNSEESIKSRLLDD